MSLVSQTKKSAKQQDDDVWMENETSRKRDQPVGHVIRSKDDIANFNIEEKH